MKFDRFFAAALFGIVLLSAIIVVFVRFICYSRERDRYMLQHSDRQFDDDPSEQLQHIFEGRLPRFSRKTSSVCNKFEERVYWREGNAEVGFFQFGQYRGAGPSSGAVYSYYDVFYRISDKEEYESLIVRPILWYSRIYNRVLKGRYDKTTIVCGKSRVNEIRSWLLGQGDRVNLEGVSVEADGNVFVVYRARLDLWQYAIAIDWIVASGTDIEKELREIFSLECNASGYSNETLEWYL